MVGGEDVLVARLVACPSPPTLQALVDAVTRDYFLSAPLAKYRLPATVHPALRLPLGLALG